MAVGLPNDKSYSYTHITTATTTTIRSTATGNIGILHSIIIGTIGTTPVITINDGAAVVAIITPTVAGTFLLDITFTSGLNIVTTGSGFDVTVTYQ